MSINHEYNAVPDVSIIVPVYNKQQYVGQMFSDLKAQSHRNFECVIVDDGSSDDSGKLCDELAADDDRFQVFHILNGGVSHARNFALERIKGTYVTFIDSDDRISSDYITNLLHCMNVSNADLVIGSSLKFWENSDKTELITTPFYGMMSVAKVMDRFAEIQMSTGIFGYCWNKLMRASLIKNIRFNEQLKLAEDLDFYLSLYPHIRSIYFDSEPNYFYLQEAENSSMQDADDKINYYKQLLIQLKMYRMLESMGALSSENHKLCVNRIYDYVFFTLFHSPSGTLKESVQSIQNLNLPPAPDFSSRNWKEQLWLGLYVRNLSTCLFFITKLHELKKRYN